MIYTEVEKKELDEVQRVFAEHLRQCPDYELLWSDSYGRIKSAMFGWPLVSNRSMWILAAGLCRRKIFAGSAWRV